MQLPNLSQSLIKELVEFFDDNIQGCGYVIRKKYFEKVQTPSSHVQRLGIYFEYKATGYLRPDDVPPEPEYAYKGTAKAALTADYERVHKSVDFFKKMIAHHNIVITKVGEYMKYDGCSGISDIRAKWLGEKCIIDVKYTSLIDDKFNDYGWHTESLPYKSKLLVQPVHYKYLIKKIEGIEDIPFYFFIFSSKDPEMAKIIRLDVQPEHLHVHEHVWLPKLKEYVNYFYKNPDKMVARPNYTRCKACDLFDVCDKRATMPQIEIVNY